MEEWKNETPEKKIERLELVKYRLESETKMLKEVVHNLAQAIRFMGTNEKLTVDDIIKEFSKENEVTEYFMKRWEKSQHEESNLKDKVIDMMAEDIINGFVLNFESVERAKEYYFNKVKENEK